METTATDTQGPGPNAMESGEGAAATGNWPVLAVGDDLTVNEDGSKPNWPLLALTRFILAIIVCGAHSFIFLPPTSLFFNAFYECGSFAAVLGFLILSGYSIAASIDRQPTGFYRRRFERLMPTYWLCFVLAMIPYILIANNSTPTGTGNLDPPTPLSFFSTAFLFLPTTSLAVGTMGQAWSLAVEVVFYAGAPFLARLPMRKMLAVIGASSLLYVTGRLTHTEGHPTDPIWFNVPTLAWAWLLGWVLWHRGRDQRFRQLGLILPVALVSISNCNGGILWYFPLMLPVAGIFYGILIKIPQRLKSFFLELGDISYPLYLIHPACFFALAQVTKNRSPLLFIGVSVGVSALIVKIAGARHHYVERRKSIMTHKVLSAAPSGTPVIERVGETISS